MTEYLVYSLQNEQRANVSTNTYVVQITYRPTRSAVEQRLTRPTSMHHCLVAADGHTGAAARYLLLSKIQRALSPSFSNR
jgi:hypothetical protein